MGGGLRGRDEGKYSRCCGWGERCSLGNGCSVNW